MLARNRIVLVENKLLGGRARIFLRHVEEAGSGRRQQFDFLGDRLMDDLSKEEVAFALFVQFSDNKKTEPIDDCRVIWKTHFHQVATIMIPRQDIDTDERRKKDLELTYSPGHAIIEHAPLGSVNMIRRKVYEQLAKERIAHQ